MRNCLVALAALVCLVITGCGQDQSRAQEALVVMAEATETDANSIEKSRATAKGIALAIDDSAVRERVLADIQKDYEKKRLKLAESDRIAKEAVALMQSEQRDLISLRQTREQAEKLARKMPTAEQTDTLLATIASRFSQQEDGIAKKQAREAQERIQELERQNAEVRLAAAQKLREERDRAAQAERRSAEAQVPQPCMCCCSYIKSYWVNEPKRVYEWMGCDGCTTMTKPWPDVPPQPYCAEKSYCGR